jgi:inorganic pyrophosphatase
VNRLRHYFRTYKMLTPDDPPTVVGEPYGHAHAEKVIQAAMADYIEHFGE